MAVTTHENSRLSLPLYAAALVITLSGVLTVAEHVGDAALLQEVVALTLAGFAFSVGCRVLKINARFGEWLCIGVIVLAVGGTLTGRVDWGALLPVDSLRNDARVAVVLSWGAVLLSWALLHDSTILFTPVLAIAEIGLTASFDLNAYVEEDFVALLLATVFLLIHYQSLRLQPRAVPAERSPISAVGWQVALTALCGFGVIAIGLVLMTPVEALSHNLSLAGAIRRLTNSGVVPPAGVPPTRFSDTRDFSIGTGAGWSASAQVLMHVAASDSQPHLWRGRTYDHYNGEGWESLLTNRAVLPQMRSGDSQGLTYDIVGSVMPGRPLLSATFAVIGDTNTFYYATTPRRLTLSSDVGESPAYGVDGSLALADRRPLDHMKYMVQSLIAPDPMNPEVQAALDHAGTAYPPAIRADYLGNMSDGPEGGLDPVALAYFHHAINQALRGIPIHRRTPIVEALAIRNWVSQHCTYSLDVPPLSPDEDHVYEFLTQTRKGYCDMFASSMTVLCRVAHLPARVATGFAPGVPDNGLYDLRALDKHAWTEVYFPRVGWLDFDPTMGTRTDGTIPSPQPPHHWNWHAMLRRLGRLPLALGSAILLLLLYVAKVEWLDKQRLRWADSGSTGRRSAPVEVWRRYVRLTTLLSALGLPRGVAETPDEYALRAQKFLSDQGMISSDLAVVTLLTDQLIAARYAGSEATNQGQTADALRAFTLATWRLRWHLFWKRFVPGGEGGPTWN